MFNQTMYHTQEARATKLSAPIKCTRKDAWLGYAYYFWNDIEDADKWGQDSKKATGSYDIYSGNITSDNLLDTVFNREQYEFWVQSVQKAADDFTAKTHRQPDRTFLCNFIMNVTHWSDHLDGILFADAPKSDIPNINFRKRIQLALYNLSCLSDFKYLKTSKCQTINHY